MYDSRARGAELETASWLALVLLRNRRLRARERRGDDGDPGSRNAVDNGSRRAYLSGHRCAVCRLRAASAASRDSRLVAAAVLVGGSEHQSVRSSKIRRTPAVRVAALSHLRF